jgi:FkbM family methyltransferase
MEMLKSLVRSSLKRLGLEVRKLSSHHTDLRADERLLLSGAPVRTVFDVGASVGSAAISFRSIYPEADIYCFEPTAEPFRSLESRFRGDPKIHPTQAAVGERAGQAMLHLNPFDETNSLLATDAQFEKIVGRDQAVEVGTVSVPLVSLDDFCRGKGIKTIDLLKLDIQGYELNALCGAKALLESRGIRLITCEVMFSRIYQGQAFYHEIAAFLAGFGYELWGLFHLMRIPRGPLGQADAIFLSPPLAEAVHARAQGKGSLPKPNPPLTAAYI